METKHTPFLRGIMVVERVNRLCNIRYKTNDYDGIVIARNVPDDMAAFIVRAVNSHADLVGALQNFINGIQTGAIVTEYDEIMENAVIRAHDAIRKARGE